MTTPTTPVPAQGRLDTPGTRLLIEGEAGIGKTTLLRAMVGSARAAGARVLQTQPTQTEGSLSFAGLADLLDPTADEVLGSLPAPQRDALAVALLRAEPGAQPPDPRTTGAATLGALRALAAAGPVLIAIDDVQWLDDASARALTFAVRRLEDEPITIVLARRAAPGRAAAPLGLPDERVERVAVEPMGPEQVAAMLGERLGWEPGRRMLTRIAEVSGGNPFFALELGRALAGRDDLGPDEVLPAPERLRDLVLARLRRAPAAHRDVLLLAAAARSPTLGLLDALVGDPAQVREAIERGEEAEVVARRGERIVFEHPLYASVLYGATRASKRRSMHTRLAAVVTDPEERARHLALATAGPAADVARALDEAAALARARGAPGTAAGLAEMAAGFTPPGDPDAAAWRLVRAVEHHWLAGDPEAALAAIARLDEVGSPPPARAAALGLRAWIELYRSGPVGALPSLERAGEILEAGDAARTPQRAANLMLRGFCETYAGRTEAGAEHLRQAAALAEELGRDALIEQVRVFDVMAGFIAGHGIDLDALAHGPAIDSRAPVLWWRGMLLLNAEEHAAARVWLEALRARSDELGEDRDMVMVLHYLAELDWREGDWASSRGLAEEALQLALTTRQEVNACFPASLLIALDAAAGEHESARAALDRWLPVARAASPVPFLGTVGWGGGIAALSAGRPEEAVTLLAEIRAATLAAGLRDPATLRFDGDLIEALIATGRTDDARALLGEMEAVTSNAGAGWRRAVTLRCRALLAAGEGDPRALTLADRALEAAEAQPVMFERARTALAVGVILRRAKRRGAARETLERARAGFEALGASAWFERADAELDRTGARPSDASALSPTEERIARLAADGLTNQRIAEAMSITVRTVESNLTRIYRKLGVARRADLVRLLTARD